MAIAALITWVIAALGGFVMLGTWLSKGGQRAGSGSRLRPGVLFGHFLLATAGLVLWIAYLLTDGEPLAWTAFALLLVVALLGFTMFARWLPARRTDVPESRFPVPVVALHGLLGAATLVLVLLTLIG